VLWDKATKKIVNNESSEIIRMFNTEFNDLEGVRKQIDLYPESVRSEIDTVNDRVYSTLNNGVYKCGFAQSQQAYEEAVMPLFATLEWLEEVNERAMMCERV
jgi:putative glutathione S-transferase